MFKVINTLLIVAMCCLAIFVEAQTVKAYENCNYGGKYWNYVVGQYRTPQMFIGNDAMSSIEIPNGFRVTLYRDDDFRGQSITLTSSEPCFPREWNDAVSSMVIEKSNGGSWTGSPNNNWTSSQNNNGITLYKDCYYQGSSKNLGVGNYRTYQLGIGNDQLSSIRIPSGFRVTLYRDDNFRGQSITLAADDDCFATNWNDNVSSIKVERTGGGDWSNNSGENDGVTLFKDCYYRGRSKNLGTGDYLTNQLGIGNDQLSSIRIPNGFRVTLYRDDNFRGQSITLTADDDCFTTNWNDNVSSIKVERIGGGWGNNNNYGDYEVVLFKDADFSGESIAIQPGSYRKIEDAGFPNDALSSIKVPRGYTVILYEDSDFRGRSVTVTSSNARISFNDVVSSIKVIRN